MTLKMKTVKVSEATNSQLDWLVAKYAGFRMAPVMGRGTVLFEYGMWKRLPPPRDDVYLPHVIRSELDAWEKRCDGPVLLMDTRVWEPTVNPGQMWPLIETVAKFVDHIKSDKVCVGGYKGHLDWVYGYGPNAMVAGARHYILYHSGPVVEVPEGLS